MEAYKLRLERFFTDGRLPAYHVGRYSSSEVYEPKAQTFVLPASLPAGTDILQPMTPGQGLDTGLFLGEVALTPSFTDGWYVVYYHDLNKPDKGVFFWEWFQVADGHSDPFPIVTVEQVVAEMLTQLAGRKFSLQASFG